jgi:hypothetical protein
MTEEQEQLIKDCEARESKLSDWERQFIDSIQFRDSLSPKQDAMLNEIWDRVTG